MGNYATYLPVDFEGHGTIERSHNQLQQERYFDTKKEGYLDLLSGDTDGSKWAHYRSNSFESLSMNEKNELNAEIRNKLQAALTVLEALQAKKEVPSNLVKKGADDLKKILEYIKEL